MEQTNTNDELTRAFTVRSYEVEPRGQLGLVTLIRMLQEVAWLHASSLGKGYVDRTGGRRYWVLSRLRMEMERYPGWGDQFFICTYPVGTDRILALREFEIRAGGGSVLGRVATGWLVVDGDTGRPLRPQRLLDDITVSAPRFPASMEKVPAPAPESSAETTRATSGEALPVRYGDIDQYRHVNNAAYVAWVLNAIAAHTGAAAAEGLLPIARLDVDYLQETLLTDRYRHVVQYGGPTGEHLVQITRERDAEPTCRARIRFASA